MFRLRQRMSVLVLAPLVVLACGKESDPAPPPPLLEICGHLNAVSLEMRVRSYPDLSDVDGAVVLVDGHLVLGVPGGVYRTGGWVSSLSPGQTVPIEVRSGDLVVTGAVVMPTIVLTAPDGGTYAMSDDILSTWYAMYAERFTVTASWQNPDSSDGSYSQDVIGGSSDELAIPAAALPATTGQVSVKVAARSDARFAGDSTPCHVPFYATTWSEAGVANRQ